MRRILIVLAVLIAFVSGCVDDSPAGPAGARNREGRANPTTVDTSIPADWAELALPFHPEHDHRDVKQHENLSTPNFEILAYDPLITDYYGKTAGDYFCGDVKEKDGRKLNVVQSWGSDVAFVLVDVTDPRQPVKLGELVMANTQVYDIAITPDLSYVVLSTSPFDSGPDTTEPPMDALVTMQWRDACTGQTHSLGPESGLPYACGIVLVDISNPRNPTVVDFRQLPVIGSHSVHADHAKGQTIITVSVDNGLSTVSYYAFFEIRNTPAGGKLVPLSTYAYVPENQQRANPSVGVHMDGLVAEHPITKQRLGWLAFRGVGFIIVNMDNPGQPTFLSSWRPFPVGIHSVLPLKETWDGRHYAILGEECGGPSRGNPSCLIYVVDTTDPARPQLVGAWTLPVPVQWRQGLQFSMHYFDLVNRTLFVSTYHGGVWAIDLSTPEAMKTMPTIGVFVPDRESPKPVGTPPRSLAGRLLLETVANARADDRPTILDVVADSSGVLSIWDAQGGLYTVTFDASRPAPPIYPAPIKGIGND